MLTKPQSDPIVEILRLAYRRGLALRQEQEKSNLTNPKHITHDKPIEKPDNNAKTESTA
jgi:hypothetical protein